tara:strand:- start:110 stop:280 length:171 start_codon:yes stop_codon:yes gene_type:complete
MDDLKKMRKAKSKKGLFNPYANGISSYDLAYLSSKKVLKNKTIHLECNYKEEYLAS